MEMLRDNATVTQGIVAFALSVCELLLLIVIRVYCIVLYCCFKCKALMYSILKIVSIVSYFRSHRHYDTKISIQPVDIFCRVRASYTAFMSRAVVMTTITHVY